MTPTWLRYSLFQIPGALIVAALLTVAARWGWIEASTAVGALLVWVLKDAALYPVVRSAYETADPHYAHKLIGRKGRARERLAPAGYVTVAGELWRARLRVGEAPIEKGTAIVVCSTEKGRLIVACDQGADTSRST